MEIIFVLRLAGNARLLMISLQSLDQFCILVINMIQLIFCSIFLNKKKTILKEALRFVTAVETFSLRTAFVDAPLR